MNRKLICKLLALFVLAAAVKVSAQGTAFMYQGRLNDNGSPANNVYDLRFALFDAVINGNPIGLPQTNVATTVTGGLFTVTNDFGPVFTGTNYWLSIGVRTNGSTNAFTFLVPRQPLLPVPYAIFANTASNLLGTVASGQISGTSGGFVSFTNATNAFVGKFTGTGSNLTSLSASQLAFGTVADARLSTNVALLNTNQIFTGANSFLNATNTFVGQFTGNGSNLTTLNGSAVVFGTVADARLSGNVAMLSSNLTFTGTNLFTGPNKFTGANLFTGTNSFTNRNNSFMGSFFGNGLVGWIPVSGIATQAIADAGYLMLNTSLSTVTLPSSLSTGDIVRISGGNAGGWLAAVNAGQSIVGNFASFRNAYPIIPPSSGDYSDVAIAADGIRMYAVGNFNGVLASTDSGKNWNQIGLISGHWNSVACSANGKIVYIAPSGTGVIEESSDGFSTWSAVSGSGAWQGISCSADGSKLFAGNLACSGNGTNVALVSGGNLSVSTNSGTSFFSIPGPVAGVTCLAVSSDCTKLVAGVNGGLLYGSANLGTNWVALTSTNQFWTGACMSPDGSKFAGTVGTVGGVPGGIYYYEVDPRPDTVSTNSIGGSRGSAVELQFIGNGQFIPVSSSGLIWAN
ncbi:MAG: sialidase family protein [Verrucomicrobiae bacterium]|nr:sialidase family protein [Verrucomicrobiae bacterium]